MSSNHHGRSIDVDLRLCIGVFAIAFATLVIEISLIRVFSFTIWYHFAYLVISVALLGTGAAGSYLSRYPAILGRNVRQRLASTALAAAISVSVVFACVTLIPFDPLQLAQPVQWMWLTSYYLLVFVPFALAGYGLALVFSAAPSHIGRLYFWDLLGAGIGSLTPLLLIPKLGAPGTIALAALMFAGASFFLAEGSRPGRWTQRSIAALAVALAVAVPALFPVTPSPAKTLWWIQHNPKAKVLSSQWHPVGRVDTAEYPLADELEDTKGHTLTPLWYGRELPADRRIIYDGDASPSIVRFDGDIEKLKPIDRLLQQTPYTIAKQNPSVLIIGLGGGFDVLVALRNRARRVVGVDIHPLAVKVIKEDFADFAGRIYQRPEVEVHAAEGRAFVARSTEKFELIQMTSVDTLTARSLGAYILAENYLFTVEAVHDFLNSLTPDGIYSIIDEGGFTAIREMGLVITALRERGIENPGDHVIVTTRGDAIPLANIMVKRSPFTPEEVTAVEEFSRQAGTRINHLPGRTIAGEPISEFTSMSPAEREQFWATQPVRLYPTTDDSPFFHSLHWWSSIVKRSAGDLRSRGTTYGQVVLLAILAQTIVFSCLFILFPLPRLRGAHLTTQARLSTAVYFSVLGVGFMFLEVSLIQRFVLFLGNPAYAISTVVASLLTSAGIGSYFVHRSHRDDVALLRQTTLFLVAVVVLYTFLLPPLFRALLPMATWVRFLVAISILAPVGFVLGRFLPIGIRVLGRKAPELVPWAWGINACLSVASTILAVLIAMQTGFFAVGLVSLFLYVVGAVVFGAYARGARDVVAVEAGASLRGEAA